MSGYRSAQLYRVFPKPLTKENYPHQPKIRLSSDHGQTNNLNITLEESEAIKRILTKNKKD